VIWEIFLGKQTWGVRPVADQAKGKAGKREQPFEKKRDEEIVGGKNDRCGSETTPMVWG